ncbi:hypothetical protein B0H19DRAFT_1078087 [Mycena capillaripes]|nr:hypothetical protein B0H19DRAFT_1078087 [Mycena capillaripes]
MYIPQRRHLKSRQPAFPRPQDTVGTISPFLLQSIPPRTAHLRSHRGMAYALQDAPRRLVICFPIAQTTWSSTDPPSMRCWSSHPCTSGKTSFSNLEAICFPLVKFPGIGGNLATSRETKTHPAGYPGDADGHRHTLELLVFCDSGAIARSEQLAMDLTCFAFFWVRGPITKGVSQPSLSKIGDSLHGLIKDVSIIHLAGN